MKRKQNLMYIFTALVFFVNSMAICAWHADLLPDYTEDVELWWHEHPFNSEGPNYDMNIVHPAATVNLNSGQSIQNAIDSAGSNGVTIYLAAGSYSNFSVIGKDNIHIIASNGATVNVGSEKYFAACSETLDYHQFNYDVYNRKPSSIACFRDPLKNIYIKGITFDGGGSQRDSHYMKVVRGIVFHGCTWQNFSYVGEHHPGMINGHEKLENVWFIDCHFVGDQYNGSYLDGLHAGGFVNCEFESGCQHGILLLTNDDFSEDFNDDGHWQWNEKRNAQYNVIVGNVFDGVPEDCIDINQGGNLLIKDNVQLGNSQRFIYSTDRCSQRWHDLFYEGFYNRIIDNTVNSCVTFYEVNSREFNCPDYSSCDNYGKLGKYQVRGNNVNCTNFVYAYGNTIYDPRFVEDNRVNSSGAALINFVNDQPSVAITSHTDSQNVPVATEVQLTASALDSDGNIDMVTFRIDDVIIAEDTTSPYEAVWMHDTVTLGAHKVSVEVLDNHGKKNYDHIRLNVVDTANTDYQTITGLPLELNTPVGTTVTKNFILDLNGATTANLYFEAFDIDDHTEAKMYINGNQIDIPCYAIAPDGPHSDARAIPLTVLNNGQNTVVFEFANSPEGTTRWDVRDFVIAVSYSGNRAAKPVLTPAGDQYQCYADITMQTSTTGSDIWYTLDGSEPVQSGPGSHHYSSAVNITADTTVKAKAFKTGMDPSFTATQTYTIIQTRNPDIDGDSDVDIDDLADFAQQWLLASYGLSADFSCDDLVDFLDFSSLSSNWQPPVTGTFMQDTGTQGIISIEAENYNSKAQGTSDAQWQFIDAPTGYSGNGAMSPLPNSGVNNDTGYDAASPVMNYNIGFVRTGTHYVWIRGGGDSGSDDSVHFGIDGTALSTGQRFDINEETGNWGWSNTANGSVAVFDIPSTGVYTFNLWMREDGARADKIVITTDSAFTPTGTGPPESPRQ